VGSFLGHNGQSGIDLVDLAWRETDVVLHLAGEGRHSQTLVLRHTFLHCCIIGLLKLREMLTTLRVNVMSKHVLSIDVTSHSRVSVALSIQVKSWFSEVGSEGRIWQPSGR
jgi:hypothetical protein